MFKEIIEKIENASRIMITSHVNPDGDAIGAGLALFLALDQVNVRNREVNEDYMDKTVRLVMQDDVPKNLKFLFGSEMVEKDDCVTSKYEFDLVIFVDAATKERVGTTVRHIKENSFVINIDHHVSNSMYADINCVEDISSTSEMIYKLLCEMDIEITTEIGEALYTGLVNDTGNFAHSNVTSKTLRMAANLIEVGVDNSKIVREFFSDKEMASLRLMGIALQEMTFVSEKKVTYFYLSQEALKNAGGLKEHTEGLVSLINSYGGSEVSVFLREEVDGTIKGSMRSKKDINVNKIAGMFGGGGHVKAAGFTAVDMTPTEIIEKILNEL